MHKFWPELFKKMSFGVLAGFGDVGSKLAAYQYINGGTMSPSDYADINIWKHFVTANLAIIPVMWTGIPFENARRAYYADKTWPIELRKGYTSPINALLRIPFEDGLVHLFRGSMPIMAFSYAFYTVVFTYY